MAIDSTTFDQIVKLDSEVMRELVETVSLAVKMSPKLASLPKEKLLLAFELLGCIANLFESCGCTVATMIENPNWRNPLGYKTGLGSGEIVGGLDNTKNNLGDTEGSRNG